MTLLRPAASALLGCTLAASFALCTLWAWPRAVRGVVGLAGYELPQVEVRR